MADRLTLSVVDSSPRPPVTPILPGILICSPEQHSLPQETQEASEKPRPLRTQIFQALIENPDGKEFLPNNEIERLTSRSIVEAELSPIVSQERLPALVGYILNRPAKKVFLMLADCGLLPKLDILCKDGFADKHLPFKLTLDESDDSLIVENIAALSRCPTTNNTWPEFSTWRHSQLRDIDRRQWCFLAPVFSEKTFEYKLHTKSPLPFLYLRFGNQSGAFGHVSKAVVHEAHLPDLSKVYLSVTSSSCPLLLTKLTGRRTKEKQGWTL